jgi:hypothetical protein
VLNELVAAATPADVASAAIASTTILKTLLRIFVAPHSHERPQAR